MGARISQARAVLGEDPVLAADAADRFEHCGAILFAAEAASLESPLRQRRRPLPPGGRGRPALGPPGAALRGGPHPGPGGLRGKRCACRPASARSPTWPPRADQPGHLRAAVPLQAHRGEPPPAGLHQAGGGQPGRPGRGPGRPAGGHGGLTALAPAAAPAGAARGQLGGATRRPGRWWSTLSRGANAPPPPGGRGHAPVRSQGPPAGAASPGARRPCGLRIGSGCRRRTPGDHHGPRLHVPPRAGRGAGARCPARPALRRHHLLVLAASTGPVRTDARVAPGE